MARSFPSLHRLLLSLNLEINSLYRSYHAWMDDKPLSEFEAYVILLEDRRFMRHSGIDWRSVAREIIRKTFRMKHGGASTIEMQFIRTVNNRRERKLRRKLRELTLAFLVQFHFEKRQTLRSYLQIAFFGSGVTGADAASLRAFGKPISNLNGEECAALAAMLVYPMPLNPPAEWAAKVKRRAGYGIALATRYKEAFEKVKAGESVGIG